MFKDKHSRLNYYITACSSTLAGQTQIRASKPCSCSVLLRILRMKIRFCLQFFFVWNIYLTVLHNHITVLLQPSKSSRHRCVLKTRSWSVLIRILSLKIQRLPRSNLGMRYVCCSLLQSVLTSTDIFIYIQLSVSFWKVCLRTRRLSH